MRCPHLLESCRGAVEVAKRRPSRRARWPKTSPCSPGWLGRGLLVEASAMGVSPVSCEVDMQGNLVEVLHGHQRRSQRAGTAADLRGARVRCSPGGVSLLAG